MSDTDKHIQSADGNPPEAASTQPAGPAPKKHWIRPTWLRRTLKTLLGVLIFILLLPVLIYIPFVQDLLVDVAEHVASDATGMKIHVDKFRLKFPLDVELKGVQVLTAKGDTMVSAGSLIADVKMLPLLHLNAKINKVQLLDGAYNMESADSSMVMKIKAGFLQFEAGSDLNLKSSQISLHNGILRDARISLTMDVWKKVPDSVASPPTPWVIAADRLRLENVSFAMSMLPTIKSLDINVGRGTVTGALLDLPHNDIRLASVDLDGTSGAYITPTPEYVKAHPAPVDTISPPSPPMTIRLGDGHLAVTKFVYATDGAKPQPGFDPSYIEVTDADISLKDFFNQSSTLRLPLTSLKAKERSGLEITSGSGQVDIDSTGLTLKQLQIRTPYSEISADAYLTYEAMAMNPKAPLDAHAEGSIGWQDIYSFMPSLKPLLSKVPNSSPISLDVDASGSLADLAVEALRVNIPGFLSLKGNGKVANALDFKRLVADLDLDGTLHNAGIVNRLLAKMLKPMGVTLPNFSVKGHVGVKNQAYSANIALNSSAGDARLDGSFSMNAESYDVDASLHGFDLGVIMPSLGVGTITGHLTANGAGFNPTKPGMHTTVDADFASLVYDKHNLAPLALTADLHQGIFDVALDGSAPMLDLTLKADGTVHGNTFAGNVDADMRNVDLHGLGFMTEPCGGSATFTLSGSANVADMLFDLDFQADNLDWLYGQDRYNLPQALSGTVVTTETTSDADIHTEGADLLLHADAPAKSLMKDMPQIMDLVLKQIDDRNLDMEAISGALPHFNLKLNAVNEGIIAQILGKTDYDFHSLDLTLQNDSLISGDAKLMALNTGSMLLDTITLNLQQRGKLLNYKAHMGNTPKNLPEFAQVNLSGYVGTNRASVYLRQKNAKGVEGYRLGLTAAMVDSTINVHFTPLNATIAYKPWSINEDNYVEVGPTGRITADLSASSEGSSIRLKTVEREDDHQALNIAINNLHIEDLLHMMVDAPDVTGAINTDLTLVYRGTAVTGTGTVGVKDLTYNSTKVGDLDLDMKAGLGFKGNMGGSASLLLNGREVLQARGYSLNDSTAKARTDGNATALDVQLKEFPLSIINPFLPAEYMQLTGALNGDMKMTGGFTAPLLNGTIVCDSVGVRVPMTATTYRFDDEKSIKVVDNTLNFKNFHIHAANNNPLVINGDVDARNLSKITFDLTMNGANVAVVNHNNRNAEIYGKLFVNLDASAKGNLHVMDINADLSVLPSTDVFYTYASAESSLQVNTTTDVVRFVQFNDTVQAPKDSLPPSMLMNIDATATLIQGAKVTVNLGTNGTDKATLTPNGTLVYTQDYMGDQRLNGTLYLGTGFVRYSIPMIGQKTFNFSEASYATWSGDMMNPALHISATDHVRANVQQENADSRLIYFDVTLSATGNLSQPKVAFDLSTDDDATVQNELLSMSPDQRQAAAINLLLYNTYTGPGVKASANLSNPLYSFLAGQLNSWAAKNIRGVDLSFGIDQYKTTTGGRQDQTTSYSYQVSKSLFDNRFKIVVGGNYSTDAQADENFAENLISDVSFEYMLKQTQNINMYVRLFRHTGFESILEGEITETGVGFVLKRKLTHLKNLFHRPSREDKNAKKPEETDTIPTDTINDK